MSQDKMQDVFPIEFDFVSGEQPDAVKFTGWRKQTDAAFSRIVEAIGDPWEYNTHTGGAVPAEYYLSPSRLAQPSLARMIGPSDYASPKGGSFNEAISTGVTATLEQDRNSWRLGFPLKKKTGPDMGPNSSSGYAGSLSDLVFDTDITLNSGPAGQFLIANLKTSAAGVTDTGDWFIDYDKGVITTFDSMTAPVVLDINNINMFGPSTPWGTANVIPSWEQTTSLCTATGGLTSWTITLPLVSNVPRSSGSTNGPDASWNTAVPGEGTKHRLPSSITSVLAVGDAIPDGFMQLWDETTKRILPLVDFFYKDEYSVTVTTPEGWLTLGPNYRLLVTGSSLAENISWLMSVVRDTSHGGLTNCQDGRTIAFTNPVSHDDMADLFGGNLPSSTVGLEKYIFTASSHPTNPHPQYIHRAGFMANDQGNSYNAMRGDFVLGGEYDSTNSRFPVGNNTDTSVTGGLGTNTYGISFGGNTISDTSGNPKINWQGGLSVSTWVSGSADRIGFGLTGTGFRASTSSDVYGALAVSGYAGTPLYLKGSSTTAAKSFYEGGGALGFDYNNSNEMNHIKLVAGYRAQSDTYDETNVPVNTGGNTTDLDISSALTGRFSSEQLRELRFRSVPYVSASISTDDSIGDINSESEFDYYFTSPSILGVDWLNVYGNAIFFSETGDGKSTSLTLNADDWLNDGGEYPAGIFYEGATVSNNGEFKFVTTKGPGGFGDRAVVLTLNKYGTSLLSCTSISLTAISTATLKGNIMTLTGTGTGGSVQVRAEDSVRIGSSTGQGAADYADSNVWLTTNRDPISSTDKDIGIYSGNDILLDADAGVDVVGAIVDISTSVGHFTMTSKKIEMSLGSGGLSQTFLGSAGSQWTVFNLNNKLSGYTSGEIVVNSLGYLEVVPLP